MAKITISTDTSLTMDENDVVSVRLSEKADNLLYFTEDGKLSTKEIGMFHGVYQPLNGIYGKYNQPLTRIQCNSSVSRLCAYDDTEGDIFEENTIGVKETDGVNLVTLIKGIGIDLNIEFWDKKTYAEYSTSKS